MGTGHLLLAGELGGLPDESAVPATRHRPGGADLIRDLAHYDTAFGVTIEQETAW